MKEQRQAARNQYSHLHKIGEIEETSPEFKALTKQEQALRKQSVQEKKFRMKDPNYIVNPKRLVIKNLDLALDVGALRIKVAEVLANVQMEQKKASEDATEGDGKKKSKNGSNKAETIAPLAPVPKKQRRAIEKEKLGDVTLMRSTERKTAEGVRRSLGYAFVEFKKHEDALAVLRRMNNNAKLNLKKRPIVEFTFDDKRALRTQELAKNRREEAARRRKAAATEEGWQQEAAPEGRTGKDSGCGHDGDDAVPPSKRRKTDVVREGPQEGVAERPAQAMRKKKEKAPKLNEDGSKKLHRGARQRQKKREQREKQAKEAAGGVKIVKKQEQQQKRETVKQAKIFEKRAQRKAQRDRLREKHGETDDLEEAYMRKMR